MSLLKDNGVSATRNRKKNEPRKSALLEEVRSGPAQEIIRAEKRKVQDELFDLYSYAPEEEPELEESKTLQSSSELEESKTLQSSVLLFTSARSFNLDDLSYFCEEKLASVLYSPENIKAKEINDLRQEYIKKNLEVYAEYSKEIELNLFKDVLYYYKGEVLLNEEHYTLSGFLRQYFNITKVNLLYQTGEIITKESNYCNFWFSKRLDIFFNESFNNIITPAILDQEKCLDCNNTCGFRHQQQMGN